MKPDPAIVDVLREVDAIVRRVTGGTAFRVLLFGSRATGSQRLRSDVDIAIDGPGPIDAVNMADIRDACERLPTLLTIDLVDLATTSAAFQAAVRAQACSIETA